MSTMVAVGFYVAGSLRRVRYVDRQLVAAFTAGAELRFTHPPDQCKPDLVGLYKVAHAELQLDAGCYLEAVRVHLLQAVDGAYVPGEMEKV